MLERQTYKFADQSLECETHLGDYYLVHDFIYFLNNQQKYIKELI